MAEGSRVCPHCGALNAIDDKTCYRCGKAFPSALGSSARGVFGAFASDGTGATKLIALMCLVVYALAVATQGGFKLDLSLTGAFRLSTLLRFGVLYPGIVEFEPWRLLASVYVHLGILHIGLNVMSLVSLGRNVEQHFGSARFIVLYTLTGIGGFGVSELWDRLGGSPSITAGASGAIFGLVGAYVGVLFARRSPEWKRALVNNLIYAAILGFVLPANNAAHLGGFGIGIVAGALLERERNRRKHDRLMGVLAGLCLVASVASVALSTQSPVWKQAQLLEEGGRGGRNSE